MKKFELIEESSLRVFTEQVNKRLETGWTIARTWTGMDNQDKLIYFADMRYESYVDEFAAYLSMLEKSPRPKSNKSRKIYSPLPVCVDDDGRWYPNCTVEEAFTHWNKDLELQKTPEDDNERPQIQFKNSNTITVISTPENVRSKNATVEFPCRIGEYSFCDPMPLDTTKEQNPCDLFYVTGFKNFFKTNVIIVGNSAGRKALSIEGIPVWYTFVSNDEARKWLDENGYECVTLRD